jgi:3-deoxy-D-manno-octulosonate 8-phosphate phosphatase (KDO 8-P phosphatase)|tara:strand:+ start:5742 stop:6206 length:465 start_codon:yes stop_codon:yes gene_type:complete
MKSFILDVDGVMTDGKFTYTLDGKISKVFGPDDSDGLIILKDLLKIAFVSADKRGFDISRKRIEDDMGYDINLVSSSERVSWIQKNYGLEETIYMGDGFNDHLIFQKVSYSITTADSLDHVKKEADFITSRRGSERAVAEACLHIKDNFFNGNE